MLTPNLHKIPQYKVLIASTRDAGTARGIKEFGDQLLKGRINAQGQPASLADTELTGLNFSTDDRRVMGRGESTYKELCSCHGSDGKGLPMGGRPVGATLAPPQADRRGWSVIRLRDQDSSVGLTGDIDNRATPA
jgi:hypothetical protein